MAVPILFDEILFDPLLFRAREGESPLLGWPEWGNTVIRNQRSGIFKTNVNRLDPIEMLSLNIALLTVAEKRYLLNIWRGGHGSGVGFRLKVPYDYLASFEPVGTINAGQTKEFTLVKTYTRPGVTARQDVRYIVKPVVNSNLAVGSVSLFEPNGVDARVISTAFAIRVGGSSSGFSYTINNTNGRLSVTTTSASGTVDWSGEFDIPAAFTENTVPFKHDVASEAQNVGFREILYPELGITVV